MAKKLYGSGKARQRAEKANRTQPRMVVTMEKSKSKPKPKPTSKPTSKPTQKPRRTIPKDVTKKSPVTRKVPQRKQTKITTLSVSTPKYEEIHPLLTRLGVTKRIGKKPKK